LAVGWHGFWFPSLEGLALQAEALAKAWGGFLKAEDKRQGFLVPRRDLRWVYADKNNVNKITLVIFIISTV
jgi:hypothetical protein